jgi:peroxiredoxin
LAGFACPNQGDWHKMSGPWLSSATGFGATSPFLTPTTTAGRNQMRISNRVWLLFLLCGNVFLSSAQAQTIIGLQPGVKAPLISLSDQTGKPQNLGTLTGRNGLLLLFFRSADWCPFCKGQLVDLERAQKLFAAKGIQVAGVSYDSPRVLAEFSRRKSITYPLLSDKGSKLIDAFGIRNVAATGEQAGIPVPGY